MADAAGTKTTSSTRQHLLTVGQVILGALMVYGWSLVSLQSSTPYYDFNLHYFAALLERSDTYTDVDALKAMIGAAGQQVPLEGVYGTPVLIALVFTPLSFLGLQAAHYTWIAISCVVLTLVVRKAAGASRYWLGWLALAVCNPVLANAINLGNFSIFTAALTFYAFGALRAGQGNRAGVALGLATAFKLYPGLLLLVLLLRKDKKPFFAALATGAVTLVVSTAVLGPADMYTAMEAMLNLGGYVHPQLSNVSLPAALLKLTHNAELAKYFAYALLVLALVVMWLTRKLAAHQALAIAAVVMLCAQSIAWSHYLTIAALAPMAFMPALRTAPLRIVMWVLTAGALGWIPLVVLDEIPDVPTFLIYSAAIGGLVVLMLILSKGEGAEQLEPANAVDEVRFPS